MGANPLHALRINAREMLRQPGMQREIIRSYAADILGVLDERVNGDIGVALLATSSSDGIVVSGVLSIPWTDSCRRCLVAVAGTAEASVEELYQDEVTVDDAYEIVGDQIDTAPMVREYVLLELSGDPLCRDACKGICAVCGVDRNTESCACDLSVKDHRWAALDGLILDD